MNVTIIGAGNMARGIGTRLLAGGNNVALLGVEREGAEELAVQLGEAAAGEASVQAGASGDPIEGDVIVLAVPYEAVQSIAEQYASELSGKIVVDITNPVDWESMDRLVTPSDSSAAEEIARFLPGATVVKAFNTTFAGTLVAGEVAGHPLDVFVASDEAGAKEKVMSLVEAGGLRAIDNRPTPKGASA